MPSETDAPPQMGVQDLIFLGCCTRNSLQCRSGKGRRWMRACVEGRLTWAAIFTWGNDEITPCEAGVWLAGLGMHDKPGNGGRGRGPGGGSAVG